MNYDVQFEVFIGLLAYMLTDVCKLAMAIAITMKFLRKLAIAICHYSELSTCTTCS